MGRESSALPAVISSNTDGTSFVYKACDPAFTVTESAWKQTSIGKSSSYEESGIADLTASAYWLDAGKVKYTFGKAKI